MFLQFAHHLWQSTLFAGAIAVFCFWLRNDGARVRYWLWWAASIKFLIPFSVLTAFGRFLAGDSPVPYVPEAWTITADIVAKPFADGLASWAPGSVLLSFWAAGSIALLARWLLGTRRLRAVLSEASSDDVSLIVHDPRIPVFRSNARVEPGIVGVFRPVLLLPAGIDERLNGAQLEAVLTHEYCHIQRRDNLTAAIHMLVECIFWFHPLVWWIGARLIDERERACDEMVVALGHDRKTYAEGILDVCELYAASPLRCAAGISGSDLQRRIKQIMRYQGMKSLNSAKKLLLSTAAIVALTIPLLAGLTVQDAAMAQGNRDAVEEYLPIVKVAPVYPARAAEIGLEGHVVVQYTVNTLGATENAVVLESSSNLFDQSAIESALKYKYRPRIVNGTAVAVEGVTTKIIYALQSDDSTAAN